MYACDLQPPVADSSQGFQPTIADAQGSQEALRTIALRQKSHLRQLSAQSKTARQTAQQAQRETRRLRQLAKAVPKPKKTAAKPRQAEIPVTVSIPFTMSRPISLVSQRKTRSSQPALAIVPAPRLRGRVRGPPPASEQVFCMTFRGFNALTTCSGSRRSTDRLASSCASP